jgi:acetyl-CoA acetyltransferase
MQMNLTPNGFTHDIITIVTHNAEALSAFRTYLEQVPAEARPEAVKAAVVQSFLEDEHFGDYPPVVRNIIGRVLFEEIDWGTVLRSINSYAGYSQGGPRFSVN